MSRLRPVPFRKVERTLQKHGFVRIHQRGSHVYYRGPDGQLVSVPRHDGRDIGVPLLRLIARQAGLNPRTFN